MSEYWAAIEAIGTCVGAIKVLGALLYARNQVGEARSAREADLIIRFHEQYHTPEKEDIRYRMLRGDLGESHIFDPAKLGSADRFAYYSLITDLEFLAVLVERKLLDFELVAACFRSTPPRVWAFVKPSALRRRAESGPVSGYIFLERLAERYDAWSIEHLGMRHPAFVSAEETSMKDKSEPHISESTGDE